MDAVYSDGSENNYSEFVDAVWQFTTILQS